MGSTVEERLEDAQRRTGRVLEAIEALSAVIEDPDEHGSSYAPQRTALLEALDWLELEVTCGDCVAGRCHWGGDRSRTAAATAKTGGEHEDPTYGVCRCVQHETSVQARRRQARLIEAGILR